VAIFQHSLPFLQSESLQTHIETIHRRAISPLANHDSTSAYSPSLTCHLPAPMIECLHRPPYKLTCFSRLTHKHFCTRTILKPRLPSSGFQHTLILYQSKFEDYQSHIHRNARPLLRAQQCCLFTLLSANEARLPSIVA
jgi:hypothetical protein